jgi:hypothetical protein
VSGDKTNEPGCLKVHLEELLDQYPMLKLLTGDAIFAQRPLLEVLQEHGCDYLFQIKENQPETLEAVKVCFAEVNPDVPHEKIEEKKRQCRSAKDLDQQSRCRICARTVECSRLPGLDSCRS